MIPIRNSCDDVRESGITSSENGTVEAEQRLIMRNNVRASRRCSSSFRRAKRYISSHVIPLVAITALYYAVRANSRIEELSNRVEGLSKQVESSTQSHDPTSPCRSQGILDYLLCNYPFVCYLLVVSLAFICGAFAKALWDISSLEEKPHRTLSSENPDLRTQRRTGAKHVYCAIKAGSKIEKLSRQIGSSTRSHDPISTFRSSGVLDYLLCNYPFICYLLVASLAFMCGTFVKALWGNEQESRQIPSPASDNFSYVPSRLELDNTTREGGGGIGPFCWR